MCMEDLPLTFGFELELVVGSPTVLKAARSQGRTKANPSSSDRDVYTYFARQFTARGLDANVYLPTSIRCRPDYSKWNFTQDLSIVEETSSMSESMHSSPDQFSMRVGMELVSPVFQPGDDWKFLVLKAMSTLNQSRILVNSSTGLHVHVGIQDRRFTLKELKRIAEFVIIFERKSVSFSPSNFVAAFDQFVNPNRLINDDVQSNCKNSVLRGLSILEAIELIESSNSEQKASPLLFNDS